MIILIFFGVATVILGLAFIGLFKLTMETTLEIPSLPSLTPTSTYKGKIYFIRSGDYVKIGYTSGDPQKRLSQLQTGNETELELVKVIAGDKETEKQLHAKFSAYHYRGEWFEIKGSLAAYLQQKPSKPIVRNFRETKNIVPRNYKNANTVVKKPSLSLLEKL